jgi:thymidine kinase
MTDPDLRECAICGEDVARREMVRVNHRGRVIGDAEQIGGGPSTALVCEDHYRENHDRPESS